MSESLSGLREIARGLSGALRPALPADAPAVARVAARDVAQVLGLAGLEAALVALEKFAGASRPLDVSLLAARIDRLADAVEHEGDWRPLREADAELGDLAARLDTTEWSADPAQPAGSPGLVTHAALEVLGDLPLDAPAALERARLSGAVASSLRAAVDWAGFDMAPRVQVVVHDSALTLTAGAGHEAGIGPAAAVLAAVEGSLARESDGRWTIRVPLHAERASFLLLRQGRLAFALPWHSVARLRMLPAGAEQALAEPVLAPFTTGPVPEGERPGALVALGLARAWVLADRIVWRISARPAESDVTGPFGSPSMAVMLDNEERYWVADAAWLLRGVELPAVEPPAPRMHRATVTMSPQPDETPSAAEEPLAESAPTPAFDWPGEADDTAGNDALAEAVARAIDSLRFERPVETPAAEAPAQEEPTVTRGATRYRVETVVLSPADFAPEPADEPAGVAEPPSAPLVAAAEPAVEVAVAPEVVAPAAPAAAPASTPEAPPPARQVAPTRERPSVAAERNPARRALVADDSMVARIFLARMLERRGYIVETVGDGAALWNELNRGPWALVCADFAMPDSHGRSHVERLLDYRAHCREPFDVIVLTRDESEDALSREAGATLVLRKPFETFALDELIGTDSETHPGDSE